MKLNKLIVAFCSTLALMGSANAAIFTGSSSPAANIVTDYSAPSALSFDLDFGTFRPITLNFMVDADDLSSPVVSFSALIRNLTGIGFDHLNITLDNVTFAAPGSITPGFSGIVSSSGFDSTSAWAKLNPMEFAELYFGNPLAAPGKSDWMLNLSGLAVGDTFSITADVPEPATYTMLLAGLSMLGFMVGRRREEE